MVSSVWRQRCGALSFCVIENETGILVFSATRSIIGRSSLMVERSSTNCNTLRPAPCIAPAIAVSSSSPAFECRRVIAGRGAVVQRARGREAERAGAHRVARQCRHRLVVVGRGGIAARAAFAHHIDAQCCVRQLRADIHVEISLRQPLHVVRKAFPGPGNAGAQHRLRNILDAFHQLDQPAMIARPAWRETDAAIAHDRRGDAVLRGGRDVLAPGDLAVVMGVNVDKAGRHQFAPGVDLFLALAETLPTSVMRPPVMATSAS